MSLFTLSPCIVVRNLKGLVRHPIDLFAYLVISLAGTATLWNGVAVLIPAVFQDWHTSMIHTLLAFVMYLGIMINLHMVKYRHSTIRNRVLIPPADQRSNQYYNQDAHDNDTSQVHRRVNNLRDEVKHLAEHFTAQPYDSCETWHICASCEVFVPPRSWHCFTCQSCVLRRDHHCIFTRACIGEDNHGNFLGFLVYLAAGTVYSSVLTYTHMVVIQEISLWTWLARSLLALYTIFFDFSLYNLIATLNFTGSIAAVGACVYYFVLASKGMTSADSFRKISRRKAGEPEYSYQNFRNFVGEYPFYRILWPFHKIHANKYTYTLM